MVTKVTSLILHDERKAFGCLLTGKAPSIDLWQTALVRVLDSPEKQKKQETVYAFATTVFIHSLVGGHVVVSSLQL